MILMVETRRWRQEAMLSVLRVAVIPCLFMCAAVASAGQIRLSGGQGTPSVIEVLADSAFVVNTGASFWGYNLQFTVPNAVTQTPGPGSVWYLTGSSAVS
jgi:hypothetical protein